MLTENEARVAYIELLERIRSIGARDLGAEIEAVVGRGRLRERKPYETLEGLSSTAALEIALRMFVSWIEPAFLVSEARILLSEISGLEVDQIKWAADRLDVVEREGPTAVTFRDDQAFSEVPALNEEQLTGLRRPLERICELLAELAMAEGASR
jgi:hypothetical protein